VFPDKASLTLKDWLECGAATKLMWDCRCDSHTLRLCGIALSGVEDLQVSVAYMRSQERYLRGLAKAMEFYDDDDDAAAARDEAMSVDAAGKAVWQPGSGGRIDRWAETPLRPELQLYAAFDLLNIYRLHAWPSASLLAVLESDSARVVEAVNDETVRRLSDGNYVPDDRDANTKNPFYTPAPPRYRYNPYYDDFQDEWDDGYGYGDDDDDDYGYY
jgi:hypothetical protein